MNIREVRADLLIKSGFAPVIAYLASAWSRRLMNISGLLRDLNLSGRLLKLSFLSTLFSSCLNIAFQVDMLDSSSYASGALRGLIFLSVSTLLSALYVDILVFKPVREFTGDVNELDTLLIENGYVGGIANLPPRFPQACDEIRRIVQDKILEIRRIEIEMGSTDTEDETVGQVRRRYRRLASHAKDRFYLDVGRFGPMFVEADKIIAEERKQSAMLKDVSLA